SKHYRVVFVLLPGGSRWQLDIVIKRVGRGLAACDRMQPDPTLNDFGSDGGVGVFVVEGDVRAIGDYPRCEIQVLREADVHLLPVRFAWRVCDVVVRIGWYGHLTLRGVASGRGFDNCAGSLLERIGLSVAVGYVRYKFD